MNLTPSFLNYVPVPLEFGTSGLRGLVADITDLEAYINVKGALSYLLGSGDIHSGSTVVIAGDLRPSTDRIMGACARAIVDSGCRVENTGKIPTPALVSHAIANRRAGVMVTGSHIPFDRNGIKLNKSAGEVLKSDEAAIISAVERVRAGDCRFRLSRRKCRQDPDAGTSLACDRQWPCRRDGDRQSYSL